ncbi:immunoglobulin-binding protein 1 [Sphaerodactylus townsendi]|uniref:immunoglobulin-binding protein 1 n=1 Tax=Sphaerodactylus townsendi TaxID=933632 RepID=UPI002025FE07|nr:immunoglobulin-binding protein 1 [Sphaerodactylus townsendi]
MQQKGNCGAAGRCVPEVAAGEAGEIRAAEVSGRFAKRSPDAAQGQQAAGPLRSAQPRGSEPAAGAAGAPPRLCRAACLPPARARPPLTLLSGGLAGPRGRPSSSSSSSCSSPCRRPRTDALAASRAIRPSATEASGQSGRGRSRARAEEVPPLRAHAQNGGAGLRSPRGAHFRPPSPAPALSPAEMAAAAAAAAEESGPEAPRLGELLESAWRLLEEVEADAGPSSGAAAVQSKVQRGIALLERAADGVAQLDLFSRQEELEEVASADLRFMLVPALLGALVLRQVGGPDPARRLEHLGRARACFGDFLRLCRDYRLAAARPPDRPPDDPSGAPEDRAAGPAHETPLLAMAASRHAKIERYKQKKEMENRLASLKAVLDSGRAEEEQIREFYLLQITKWVNVSLDEIESIDQEIAILSRRDALRQGSATRPSHPPRPPMKSFILTRDAAQAKVFGAGYPSLATMTVDDWYERHQKQGALPDQGISQAATAGTEEQQKEKEEEEEKDSVWKAREWDDWKDMHPRGYGNRKNMG